MPSSMAFRVLSMLAGLPSRRISPASGASIPDKTLMMVDLPAPFWPTSAWISPRPRTNATPSSASTPGNCFVRLRTSSTGDPEIISANGRTWLQQVSASGTETGFHSLIARHDVGQRLFEGKLLDVVNLVVGALERRPDILPGDQNALNEKLLLIGLVRGDLIGQVGLPEARILRRQQDRAFQDAVAHRLETFFRAIHGHQHNLPLPSAARDDLGGGHGQAVA